MMSWFKKQILGVDLGTRTIKGVKLKKGKDGRVSLAGHFFQDLATTSEEFPVRNNREEAFRAAIEVQKLSSSYAATTIRDAEVMSFHLDLPKMSENEMTEAVSVEISEQAHISMADHTCDYLVTEASEDNPDVTQVKAYCVKKDVVLEQMKQLKDAGLKPTSIESEMMAITAMLEFNSYLTPKEVVMVLDLGEGHVTSGLIVDGNLALTRNHEVSFGSINRALQDQLRLSYDDAEKAKVGYDFLSVPEENAINRVMDDAFTQIFKSVKAAIDFYKDCSESGGRVDRIFLVGGGSQIKGMDKIHEIFFKIPTTLVNPFRNIDIFTGSDEDSQDDIVQLAPYMGTAVGLALNSISNEGAA